MHRQLRLGSWLVLTLCLFLPFARGCSDAPVYPREFAFSSRFLLFGLPFLYPLFVLAIGRTKHWWAAMPENAERASRIYLAHVALFGASVGQWLWEMRHEERDATFLVFITAGIGLWLFSLRSLPSITTHNVLKSVERQQAGYSLISMIYFCFMAGWEAVLWGGWLALCSSGLSWWLSLK